MVIRRKDSDVGGNGGYRIYRQRNMLYKTGRADGSPTFGGKYAKKTMEILVRLQ